MLAYSFTALDNHLKILKEEKLLQEIFKDKKNNKYISICWEHDLQTLKELLE